MDSKSIVRTVSSGHIYVVMLFILTGFFCIHTYLNRNIIQNVTDKKVLEVSAKQWDKAKKTWSKQDLKLYYSVNDSLIRSTGKDAPQKAVTNALIFHHQPLFLVWTMLIVISISLASGCFPMFVYYIIELRRKFKLKFRQILFSVLAVLCLFGIVMFTNKTTNGYFAPEDLINQFQVLFKSGSVLLWIVGATFFLITPEIATVFLIAVAAGKIKNDYDGSNFKPSIRQLDELNKLLNRALQVLAVIIVFSVLQSDTLGRCVKSMVHVEGYDIFPKYASLIYGLFFSFFLAIIYIPVQVYLNRKLDQLKMDVASRADLIDNEEEYLREIEKVSSKTEVLNNFKLAFTIMAPFISSFLPGVFD